MPFSIRPSRRFPLCCPVTYHCGDFEGHGTLWNLSLTGWCFSGNLPLRIQDVCSLTVNLPTEPPIYVIAASVHWVQRGEEYGVETLVIDDRWIEVNTRRTAQRRRHDVDREF